MVSPINTTPGSAGPCLLAFPCLEHPSLFLYPISFQLFMLSVQGGETLTRFGELWLLEFSGCLVHALTCSHSMALSFLVLTHLLYRNVSQDFI